MIINLISGPRNISTALMYSFAQHSKVKVVDEPFYAYYLQETGLDHPGKEEVLQSMSSTPDEILEGVDRLTKSYEVVFLKNMAHHHLNLNWNYLLSFQNVFLIRDPKQLIASFAQVIPQPTMLDIGLQLEAEILEFVLEKGHYDPIVSDSNDILKNPEVHLSRLCTKLELDFQKSMLSWEKGPIPEDGVWAKYWYKNVHSSTGFAKQKTSQRPLPTHCEELYSDALPFYEQLKKYTL